MAKTSPHYEVEDQAGTPLAIGDSTQRPAARPVDRRDATRYTTRTAALIALARAGLACEAVEIVRVSA